MDYQQPKFYRFSEDSLWLARLCQRLARGKPKNLVDVGSGCGVVGIEIANRIPSLERIVLLEPLREFQPFLQDNLKLLCKEVSAEIVVASLEDDVLKEKFDLLVSNPPYFNTREGRVSPDPLKAACRSFKGAGLVEFLTRADALLARGGQAFVLGHRSNSQLAKALELPFANMASESRQEVVCMHWTKETLRS